MVGDDGSDGVGGSSNVENGSYAQKVAHDQVDDGGRRCSESRET